MHSPRICQSCGGSMLEPAHDQVHCLACYLREGLAPAGETPRPADAGTVIGDYELGAEIGRGGMGVVYLARQRNLNRTVAIKLLVGGRYSSEAALRRFRVEAESAAALRHPGIVGIHEFGEHDGQPFYAMEYVDGRDLGEISGGQPLAPARAATYTRAIADAVHYAHTHGIVHRDLKPSNVLVDADDRPRITDFGLAKQLAGGSQLSIAGPVLGSPNYAAPEQTSGQAETAGPASDVYSLGALLYHLLTGRPPFLASTVPETLRLVHASDPVAPRVLNPDVPADLDTICLKCLEKSPARRYASAQALADELGRFLRGEPILARPVPPLERAWRWCRRHPAIAALAASVVIVLSVAAATFYISARRIDHALASEQVARAQAEENLYAANMQVMSRAFTSPVGADPQGMRESLEWSRPRRGVPDHRGFEWRYFWRKAQSDARATLAGHAQVLDAVLYSPDGHRLASHSLDGTLKLWDAGAARAMHTIAGVAHPGGFTPDGDRFVFSKFDRSLWEIDLHTGATQQRVGSTGRLLALHPDGRQAIVLDAAARPRLQPLDAPAADAGTEVTPDVCLAVSADGRRAALASPPNHPYPALLVVDIATGREVAALIDPRPVIALALSADGTRLVSSGFDGVLKVWDVDRGEIIHSMKAFIDPAWGVAFSRDGRFLAAGGHNRTVKLWATDTWQEAEVLAGHRSTIRCLDFAPDGTQLASGAEDNLALVWPTRSARAPEVLPRALRGPDWIAATPSIAFSPDSRLIAGTAADGTIKVWRADTLEPLAAFPMDARTVAFATDGHSLAGEGYDGVIRRFPLAGGGPGETLAPRVQFANWIMNPLTPQERVALVGRDTPLRVDCSLCEIPSGRDGITRGAMLSAPTIALSPDGRTMFVGLPQGALEAWDVGTCQRRYTVAAHQLNVTALAVSADGRWLASGSLDNSTKLWDAATGRPEATFHIHNRPVWALAFSPDGRTLASGSCDKEIILCSVPLRKYVAGLPVYSGAPTGYQEEIRLLRFSPDGNTLAAALGDGTLRFFRAASFTETDARPARPPG